MTDNEIHLTNLYKNINDINTLGNFIYKNYNMDFVNIWYHSKENIWKCVYVCDKYTSYNCNFYIHKRPTGEFVSNAFGLKQCKKIHNYEFKDENYSYYIIIFYKISNIDNIFDVINKNDLVIIELLLRIFYEKFIKEISESEFFHYIDHIKANMKKEIIFMISNIDDESVVKKQGIKLVNSFLDGIESISYERSVNLDTNLNLSLVSINNLLNEIKSDNINFCVEDTIDLFYTEGKKLKQILHMVVDLLIATDIYVHFNHERSQKDNVYSRQNNNINITCNFIFTHQLDEIDIKHVFKPFYSLDLNETHASIELEKWRLVYLIVQSVLGDIYFDNDSTSNLHLSIPIKETDQNIESHTVKILKGKKAIIVKSLLERAKLDNLLLLYVCEGFKDANLLYSELQPDYIIIMPIVELEKEMWREVWCNAKIIVFNPSDDALNLKYKLITYDIEE